MTVPAVSCEGVSVVYGGFRALDDVTVDFAPNMLSAIIGPNGAGKTTFLNVLTGLIRPAAGAVRYFGEEITSMDVVTRARKGIGRSFQTVNIFPEISVRNNLRLAAQRRVFGKQPFWRDVTTFAELDDAVDDVLPKVGLVKAASMQAGHLSHGNQRALELGLSIIGQPTVLLLDEPLAGIGRDEIEPTVALLRKLSRTYTMLVIEHNMDAVMSLADDVVVLVGGSVLTRGSAAAVREDSLVREAYLG